MSGGVQPQGRAPMAWAALCASLASAYAVASPAFDPPAPPAVAATALAASSQDAAELLPITFSALQSLADAEVRRGHGRAAALCPKEGTRHRCGGEAWNFVGPYAERSAGRATRCIWVHPANDRQPRHLIWRDVAIGARLVASLVLLDGAGRGKAVRARISVDDDVVGRLEVSAVPTPGNLAMDLPPGPERADLDVQIDADNNQWRLACLSLQMRGRRPAAPPPRPLAARASKRLPSLRGLMLPMPATPAAVPGARRARQR